MRKVMILAVAMFCVTMAGVAGIFASGSEGVTHSIKNPVVPDKTVSVVEEPAKPEVIKPMGDPSPKAEESTFAITNVTPLALVDGIFAARARNDQPWLARTLESTAGHAEITQDDCATGWRQYLYVPELWDKLEAANRQSPATVEIEGDMARVNFDVGGDAGVIFIQFRRINGAWYLADR